MVFHKYFSFFFFFNDTATTEIYTLSLHDALPISAKVTHSPNPGGFAGRGVPDLAGNADPATGYRIRVDRSEEHTSELQSQSNLVCRLLLDKKKITNAERNALTQCVPIT